jgi:hypothetical protein
LFGGGITDIFTDQFNVTPGLHTQDLKYIFNDPQNPAFKPVAQDTLQNVIASFVVEGVPKTKPESPEFPRWGADGNIVSINEVDAPIGLTDVNQTRCDWWQTFRSKSN